MSRYRVSRDGSMVRGANSWCRRPQVTAGTRCRVTQVAWTLSGARGGFRIPSETAVRVRMAASVPSRRTWAAARRPDVQRVSSPGVPVTVTTGVRALAVIRTRPCPGSVVMSSRTSSTPTGALRSTNRAMPSRPHRASDSAGVTFRSAQPGVPRRMSSWCTKNSTRLARSSIPGMPNRDSRGGPFRIAATRSPNDSRSVSPRCTRRVYPASGPIMMPAPASGRRSLSTRWAARSRVVQPSHSVGADGPVCSSSAHSARRSSRARVIPRW